MPRHAETEEERRDGPVIRITDDHHRRGYRELCSPQEMRRRKHELLRKKPRCYLCGYKFTHYRHAQLEHVEPSGMFGANQDDHRDNLELAHGGCNGRKGSIRLTEPRCAECGVLKTPHFPQDGKPAVVDDHEFVEPQVCSAMAVPPAAAESVPEGGVGNQSAPMTTLDPGEPGNGKVKANDYIH